ncbi:hypothetical protein JXA32_13730 [Candidatus Sumerlaeota bacterium]|nr:hypothetical protein [Candidatus Sumerlaeota bacterium]
MSRASTAGAGAANHGKGVIQWTWTIVLSILTVLFVCIVTPYNNFIIANSYISDTYLPLASMLCVILISLVINPLMRMFVPALTLNFRQLAMIFAVALAVAVTPSSGLLRMLPYAIANTCQDVSSNKMNAEAYAALDPPPALFPDKLQFGGQTPVTDPFISELKPGETIPWAAWLPPLFSWSGFLIPYWLMVVALGVIVFPQWRDNERLPFPLITVMQSLIETPEQGRRLPPIFSRRSFLIGVIGVFALHLLTGLDAYCPGFAPKIPLSFDTNRFFTEEPLNSLPWYTKYNRIYFTFIGIAFFMPNRVGFSIWSFQVIYALYIMIGVAYFPPFAWGSICDHSTGALFGTALVIVWLGRKHGMHVLKCMLGKIGGADDRSYLLSGWSFWIGCAGMLIWLLWVGVPAPFAIFYVAMLAVIALVLTRIIAESGLPMLGGDTDSMMRLLRLIPAGWHNAASAFFGGFVSLLFGSGNRLCAAVFTTHAIGLDRQATQSKRASMGAIMLAVIIVSVVVCGAVHLWGSYNHSVTLNGLQSPIGNNGTGLTCFDWSARALLLEQQKGAMSVGNYHQIGHLFFGFFLALLLQYMCLNFTWWPLHPVALLFVGNWYASQVWVNVFIGWLAKILILRYGGSRVYRSASPFFIGLVIGEMIAVAFWTLISGVRAFNGMPYEIVDILPF